MSKRLDAHLQDMALRMTLHCVRNTVIEDYHAAGKISQEEMKEFNTEVVNKIYSFLQLTSNPKYIEDAKAIFVDPIGFYPPVGWNKPVFDKSFRKALRALKK